MERNLYAQSVIAKLMGLNEKPHQQPVQTRKRVLSENYLRKTASIGLREKRPIKESHSLSPNTEKELEFKVVLGMSEIIKKENEKCQQSKALNEVLDDLSSEKEALFRYFLQIDNAVAKPDLKSSIIPKGNRNHRKIDKIAPRNILRSSQKLENGFATEFCGVYHLPTKIVSLKPKSITVKNDVKSSLSVSSPSENSKQRFSSPINLKESSREKEVITSKSKLKSRPRISISSWNVLNSGVKVDETSPEVKISSNYLTFEREAKERLSDRWKMTKVAQEVRRNSCKSTLNDMLSGPDLEVTPKTLENDHLEENRTPINSGNNNLTLNASNLVSASNVRNVMGDVEIENVGLVSGGHTKQQSMSLASDLFVTDGYSPCFIDDSAGQEYEIRSHEYAVDYLNCMSSGEAYQPSPNSVLEPPFKEDFSPVSHCYQNVSTDLQGLWNELQLLKSDSEETNSEGTGMNISSDGDATEKSDHSSSKNTMLTKFLTETESKDFSYMLDILEESGLHGGPTILTFDSWHSPECLLDPSVFEELEKKYSDHMSWNKTERRLLFDRVNERLMEILKPWLDVHINKNPLRKKLSNALKRDLIEEELWNSLVSEEKEANKELSEKAVGRESWVEFSDEVETISIEIEKFLFDELVEELVGI